MSARTVEDLLPAEMLQRFRERAPRYDAENSFFADDFAELQQAGYLAAPVPAEFWGADHSGGEGEFEAPSKCANMSLRGGASTTLAHLDDLLRAQRRLAAHAPATALGVNMHLVWVQVARFLHDRGDHRLDWVLREAAAGEVFAFGISEAENEAVLLDARSTAKARPGGGYLVSGTKVFTTLSPVWTRLGLHAKADTGAASERLVFGFVRREAAGIRGVDQGSTGLRTGAVRHPGVWNPLGMRATQSWSTELVDVEVREADVAGEFAPFDPSDALVLAIFASFSLLTASVYAGIADRALELAAEAVNRPVPVAAGGGTRLDDPDTAARLTHALLEHRASLDALELLARDVDERRERDDWFIALAAARNRVCDEARAAVEVAMRCVGSRAFQADSELARLYRDVAAGLFHPSSSSALMSSVLAGVRAR